MTDEIIGAPPSGEPGPQDLPQPLEVILRSYAALAALTPPLVEALGELPYRKFHRTALYYLESLQMALGKVVSEHSRAARR